MTKRHNGEGSIRQRPNGRWEARYTYEDSITGQIKRGSSYADSAKDARDAMRESLARAEQGAPVRDASITVAAWVEHWLNTSLMASSRKESTKELYRSLSSHLVADPFGGKRLDRLKPTDVELLIVDMRQRPGRQASSKVKGKAGHSTLSPATIQRVFVLLRLILDGAVRDGLIARNPAKRVQQPSVPRVEAHFLTGDQTRLVLADARDSRAWPVLTLIALTGLRRGEALALTWKDVDFDGHELQIRRTLARINGELVTTTPKTTKSRRTLPMSQPVDKLLREHKARQLGERLRAGRIWEANDLVFATELGHPIDPRNILRAVSRSAKRVGIEHPVGVHSLRHSAATAMLEAGVNLKAVSDLLGHADIRMTANTYGHVTDAAARSAMDSLGSAMELQI
jgi:integrase